MRHKSYTLYSNIHTSRVELDLDVVLCSSEGRYLLRIFSKNSHVITEFIGYGCSFYEVRTSVYVLHYLLASGFEITIFKRRKLSVLFYSAQSTVNSKWILNKQETETKTIFPNSMITLSLHFNLYKISSQTNGLSLEKTVQSC